MNVVIMKQIGKTYHLDAVDVPAMVYKMSLAI